MNHEEFKLQRSVVQYLEAVLPPPPEGPCWTAINPLPGSSAKQGAMAKAAGVKAGMPDLIVFDSPILCVELKRPGEKPTKKQASLHAMLALAGVVVKTCTSIAEVQRALVEHGIKLRGRMG